MSPQEADAYLAIANSLWWMAFGGWILLLGVALFLIWVGKKTAKF